MNEARTHKSLPHKHRKSSTYGETPHGYAGAKDQFTDGSPIRLWLREQAFGFLGMRTELLANKIGNPLGAGEVQIFFRTEVVGDGSDILPGLGGYLASGIAGAADTYWGKNKGRSMEGALVKSTKFLAIAFIVISIVLNLNF